MSTAELAVQWLAAAGLFVAFVVVVQIPGYRRGFRPLRRPPGGSAPRHSFDPAASSTFKATTRIGLWGNSWPVEITVDPAWIRLRSLWLDRSLVTGIRTWPTFVSTGYLFTTADGRYDGVILWSTRASRVTATFVLHGWPTPSPAPVLWQRGGTHAEPAPERGS